MFNSNFCDRPIFYGGKTVIIVETCQRICFGNIPVSSGRGPIFSVSKIKTFLFGNAFLEQNPTFGVRLIFTNAEDLKRNFLPLKRHFFPFKRHFSSLPSSFESETIVSDYNISLPLKLQKFC